MTFQTIGDLAQGFALRRQNTQLKQQMDRLSQELASGLSGDVTHHLAGDFMQLADVQHRLTVTQSYLRGAEQGRLETGVMQTALETVQTSAEALSLAALAYGTSSGASGIGVLAGEARGTLATMVVALNANAGGRALFSGNDVTTSPLTPVDDLLSALQTAVSGAANAIDMVTALDTFFDTAGGGFDALIYQGGTAPRGAYLLGDGESVALDLRADDPAVRAVLKQVALAALLDDPGITLTGGEQFDLARQAGETLLAEQNRITDIRADLGFAEGRIDRAASRLSAEQSSLGLVQAELMAVDPYETAANLEAVQLRLETLYTLTSRMSRLSLVNYL